MTDLNTYIYQKLAFVFMHARDKSFWCLFLKFTTNTKWNLMAINGYICCFANVHFGTNFLKHFVDLTLNTFMFKKASAEFLRRTRLCIKVKWHCAHFKDWVPTDDWLIIRIMSTTVSPTTNTQKHKIRTSNLQQKWATKYSIHTKTFMLQ